MDQLQNNPQMMAMAQMMMQDPEIMQMMQQPGMMERVQGAMANPASAMQDPDMMKIIMKLQSLGMGGGGGGGGGGYGSPSPAPAGNTAAPANILHISTPKQLASTLAQADNKLVVIDYFTTWCGPCKQIAPLFNELAQAHKDKVVFVKVDGDQSRDLCLQQGIQGFPTFEFYVKGQKIENFSGADQGKLRQIVEQYATYEPPPPPCPYKHFPLKEAEQVKYADMKWELVAPKFREINAKYAAADVCALTEPELKSVDSLIKTVQDKSAYHSSNVSREQMAALTKLMAWPAANLGPVINLLRMAVFHPAVAKHFADESDKKGPNDLVSALLKMSHGAEKPVTALLAIRALVNGFSRRALAKAIGARYEEVFESTSALYKKFADENLRLSIIALYINFAILFTEDIRYFEQAKVLLLTVAQDCVQLEPFDPKIVYRCAVIIGTIVYADPNATELCRDLDVLDAVGNSARKPACAEDAPTKQVLAELTQALKVVDKA